MTDAGNGGGWNPERRPDGSPDHGQPSYQQPTEQQRYDQPGGQPSYQQPTEQQRYDQPSGQPSYQQPTEQQRYDQPSGQPSYQQPTEQQRYDQPSGQPSYQQPTEQQHYNQPTDQPGYGQSYGQGGYGGYAPPTAGGPDAQPTQVQGYGAYGAGPTAGYGGYGAPGTGQPPAGKRSAGKIALVIGIVVVVVAGLGVGAWALFLRGGPAVTWQGKEVANPEAVLTEAQNDLTALVDSAKGAKGDDTRCYFAVQDDPPKDTPATDVTDTVYCGPALFVDGDTDKPYIPYGLTAAEDGDNVTLTVAGKGSQNGATSVPNGQKLVRPDGASAPSGAGGLEVPEPPAAEENVFTAVEDVDVPDAPDGARMASLKGGVAVTKLGEIKRYGSGTDARSAPEGQKLIAFELGEASGDGANDGPQVLGLQVSVDGGTGEDIPDLSGTNVIAVPDDAKSVDLVTKADGIAQSISLLDGKPGSGNLAVLARSNRLGSFTPPAGFNFTETGGGASADRPCTLSGSVAGLFYWVDDKGSAAASAPGNAILETDLKYTFSTNSPPPFTGSSAGDSATFEPSHLTLTLPDGQQIPAKIVSDRTVFEVPASFTEGTVTVAGAYTNTNAITFTVASPVSFKISIPAS